MEAKKRILVVEDEKEIAELEKRILESNGYEVEVALCGIDAIKALTKGKFDLMILDIMMPDLDGFALAELCSFRIGLEKDANPPIIFVTAKEEAKDIQRGREIGARAYITKPFSRKRLVSAVDMVLGFDRLAAVAAG